MSGAGEIWSDAFIASTMREGSFKDGAYEPDLVAIPGGFFVPRRYSVDVDDPRYPAQLILDVVVDDAGAPQCRGVQVIARPGEPGLTREDLKIGLATLVQRSLEIAAYRVEAGPDNEPRLVSVRPGDYASLRGSTRSVRPQRQRRDRLGDDRLREVAELYRYALASDDAAVRSRPVKAVVDAFAERGRFYARNSVARWIWLARKKGFLGEAPKRGVAGEKIT